jgi:hypothetical protein
MGTKLQSMREKSLLLPTYRVRVLVVINCRFGLAPADEWHPSDYESVDDPPNARF